MAMRIAILTLFVVGLAGADAAPPRKPATSQPSRPAKKKPPRKKQKPAVAAKNSAARALRTVIENAEFEDMTFVDFTEWLARTTKTNVVVRWEILEREGVERDAPITVSLKNVKIAKLLSVVFDDVTKDLLGVKLAASPDGNILLISTRKDIFSRLIMRTYEVEDLLIHVPSFKGTRSEDNPGENPRRTQGGGGSRFRQGGEIQDPNAKLDKRTRDLINAITSNIDPPSWYINGGRGTISYFQGKLVVRNHLEAHQEICRLLGLPPPVEEEEPADDKPKKK